MSPPADPPGVVTPFERVPSGLRDPRGGRALQSPDLEVILLLLVSVGSFSWLLGRHPGSLLWGILLAVSAVLGLGLLVVRASDGNSRAEYPSPDLGPMPKGTRG